MKSTLQRQTAAGLLFLLITVATAAAQNPPPGEAPVGIDPTTGLPLAPSPVQWISPDWVDPEITLTNVEFNGLPATEVARFLRQAFQDKFDIVIPDVWTSPSGESVEPGSYAIQLHLKNVTASEIFRAMNMLAEAENAPFRWQLLINGKRPMVFLQVLPKLLPPATRAAASPAPKQIMVYYVGDLIGNGGMTVKQIADTLADVNNKGYGGDIYIGFHDETQLVIIKGTRDQIQLVHDTLDALKQKMVFTLGEKKTSPAPPAPGDNSGNK